MSKSFNHNQRDRREDNQKAMAKRKVLQQLVKEREAQVELKSWTHAFVSAPLSSMR